jgi:nicotinate-nucleotide adenylyltransferase
VEKIGILGGTFNPVHTGHLLIAQAAREQYGLERVLLMPCYKPPHKNVAGLAPATDRLAMVRLAVRGDPGLGVCNLELERGGISYAVTTMKAFRQRYPGILPHFIIGMDSLRELHLWRNVRELLELCPFIVVDRPGMDRPVCASELPLPAPWPLRLLTSLVRGRLFEVSSSEIRRRVAENRTIRYLVPEAVEDYIRRKGLYGAPAKAGQGGGH